MIARLQKIPMIPLLGINMLPGKTLTLDLSRPKSIAAAEQAMVTDQIIFLVAQTHLHQEIKDDRDFYRVGTISYVKQLVKMPGDKVRVTLIGRERAEFEYTTDGDGYYIATVKPIGIPEDTLEQNQKDAMLRVLKEKLEENWKLDPKSVKSIESFREQLDLAKFMNQIAMEFQWGHEALQSVLECDTLEELYELELQLLLTQIEINRDKRDFQNKVKTEIDKNQRNYILREQLRVIRKELGESNPTSEADEMREQLKKIKASTEVKDRIKKEINRFENMMTGSSEVNMLKSYLDTVLELPWNKTTKDNTSLSYAKDVLEADHYGLEKVKERILEYLAVRILTKKGTSPILCLVGPPGTGKTSIARSIAKAMGRKYVRISLGGVHDEAEIRGHRRTYVAAMPGRIVDGLKQAGVGNPLMLLDEIDKVSRDYKGDTSAALLEVLDGEQNTRFRDHYVEIPIDLSEVMFIATANTTQTIPGPLLDRMEIIEINSYTENEKYHIAKNYLIPKQLEKNGLSSKELSITGAALEKIIHSYTREAGLRNLERRFGDICRKVAREVLEKKKHSVRITDKNLEHYLGREKVFFDAVGNEAQVGIVRGLAWTRVGGDTLQIEVNVMPGKGVLLMTGQMGDVMKESAQIALTYVRSVASDYGVKDNYFEKHDIHLHIPEGAVPKDGPSAGITMATAMLSAVTGRKVQPRVAMTGEVTLRGHVLMIGGLKEKLLAAKMAQVEKVLVPAKNMPDVEELSKEITKGMEIVYVKEMDEVIREAFVPEK